jgi:hypothetical protein
MFNIPWMRKWLKQAHIINKPFSPEDLRLRKVFAPNEVSKKTQLEQLFTGRFLQSHTHKD